MTNLAATLMQEDYNFLYNLITAREKSEYSQQDIADKLGMPLSWVQNFEEIQGYPALSEIRHYAYAIGVAYSHKVEVV